MTEYAKYDKLRTKVRILIKKYRLTKISDIVMIYNEYYKVKLDNDAIKHIRLSFIGRRVKFEGNKNYRYIRG